MKTELIKKHLEDQYTLLGGELHHFSLTGKIVGNLRLALRAMMDEFNVKMKELEAETMVLNI